MDRSRPALALPALLLANLVLACGPWLVRLAQADGGVGPVAAGFWRLTLALPVLVVAARAIERTAVRPRTALLVAAAGAAFAADLALWHVGILRTRLANATLLGNVTALLFPLYGFLVARSWPRPRQWIALALAAAGVAALGGGSYALSPEHLLGDLACLAAGLCYTLYLVGIDRARGTPPIATLAIACLAGAPLLLAVAVALGETVVPRDWTALLLLAAGSQIVGQGLILYGVARAPPLIVGLMLLTQPVVAATIGWLVYGERLGPADIAGGAAIATAVLLVRDARRSAPLPPQEARLGSRA